MTQGDATHRRVGNMLRPTTELCHRLPTNTLQPPTTKRSTEGHEERQPGATVHTR